MSRRTEQQEKHYKRMQGLAVFTMIVFVSVMSVIALGGVF